MLSRYGGGTLAHSVGNAKHQSGLMCPADLLQQQASGHALDKSPLPNRSLVDACAFGKPCAAFAAQPDGIGAKRPTLSAHGYRQVTGRLRIEALRIDQLAFGARRFAPVQERQCIAAMGVTVDEDTGVIPVGIGPLGGVFQGAVPGRHFARRRQAPPLLFDEFAQPMRPAAASPETGTRCGRPPEGLDRAADGAKTESIGQPRSPMGRPRASSNKALCSV